MAEIELNEAQQDAIRRMMEAVVSRDETLVAEMLRYRTPNANVYAAPASDFWVWADNYGDAPLNLVIPPGDVTDWGIWGFPVPDRPDVLALHVDVWADWGQTDLTIQFDLAPVGDGHRVELNDMHVM